MKAKERLIVALDVDSYDKAVDLIEGLDRYVDVFKVGIAPFTDYGQKILGFLEEKGKKVFLDLKFHDIPNTVRNAAKVACKKNVFMMNFHCIGGSAMLKAASLAVKEIQKDKKPILLGVTVLTSMTQEDLTNIGISEEVEAKVLAFAEMAKASGMDGVVASAKEAKRIKEKVGKDFIVVTPGVRPDWAAKGDQKRVLTPKAALEEGADYLVVGRPIIQAEDPQAAARKIIEEIETVNI